jgi:predicted transglutaminase-like cysteine proteinase
LCAALLVVAATEPGFSSSVTPGAVTHYRAQFGGSVPGHLTAWQDFVKHTKASAASAEDVGAAVLMPVNRFFNGVPAYTDQDHWGVDDYWATPEETLSSNGADCEDYAIAKFYTLKELGVPVSQLRLVYARSTLAHGAHMVLAYYARPGADPLILDNLEGSIEPAARRTDLQPVYSFNDEDLQLVQVNAPSIKVNPASNRKWAAVLSTLQRELTY